MKQIRLLLPSMVTALLLPHLALAAICSGSSVTPDQANADIASVSTYADQLIQAANSGNADQAQSARQLYKNAFSKAEYELISCSLSDVKADLRSKLDTIAERVNDGLAVKNCSYKKNQRIMSGQDIPALGSDYSGKYCVALVSCQNITASNVKAMIPGMDKCDMQYTDTSGQNLCLVGSVCNATSDNRCPSDPSTCVNNGENNSTGFDFSKNLCLKSDGTPIANCSPASTRPGGSTNTVSPNSSDADSQSTGDGSQTTGAQ